jgi:hypothetical protein
MGRLLSAWLHVVSVVVPAAERERWREEWHADVDDIRASGADVAEVLSLALGIAGAAFAFRFEGMTMDGWRKWCTRCGASSGDPASRSSPC